MMAHWCGERGFQTSIIERKFAANFSIGDNGNDEPQLALCGVDNALARFRFGGGWVQAYYRSGLR